MKKDTAFSELAFETLDLDSSPRYILSSKLKKLFHEKEDLRRVLNVSHHKLITKRDKCLMNSTTKFSELTKTERNIW